MPSIFGITSSQLITLILPYRRRWTMPTCAQCSKFLPKSGLCTGCGLDNNRRMINTTTATSASVSQPNSNYSTRMSHIPDDLPNINAALSDIRGQLNCLGDIKQSLSKLDDITASLRECMERVENLQRSFYEVSRRVDGLSSAQHQLTTRCDNLERRIATCVDASRPPTTDSATTGTISSISRRLQRLEEVNWHHELAVTGLPDFPNSSITDVIYSLATAISVPFVNTDVAAATSINSKKSNSKTLIVRFTSAIIRDSWLNKKRAKKDLKAVEVFPNWPETRIYINERSTANLQKHTTSFTSG